MLTLKTVLVTVVVSLGLFIILSWVVHFGLPELGVKPSGRMANLTAHANILGRLVILFLGALFLLLVYRYCCLQRVVAPAVLGLATLAFSDSRTSMLAFSTALVIFSLPCDAGPGCCFHFTL